MRVSSKSPYSQNNNIKRQSIRFLHKLINKAILVGSNRDLPIYKTTWKPNHNHAPNWKLPFPLLQTIMI